MSTKAYYAVFLSRKQHILVEKETKLELLTVFVFEKNRD